VDGCRANWDAWRGTLSFFEQEPFLRLATEMSVMPALWENAEFYVSLIIPLFEIQAFNCATTLHQGTTQLGVNSSPNTDNILAPRLIAL